MEDLHIAEFRFHLEVVSNPTPNRVLTLKNYPDFTSVVLVSY